MAKKNCLKRTKELIFNQKIKYFQFFIIFCLLVFIAYLLFLYFLPQKELVEEEILEKEVISEIVSPKEEINKEVDEEIEEEEDVYTDAESYSPFSSLLIRTFGDSFTSLVNVNRELTDMHWDYQVSALLFPPLIDMQKIETCSTKACGHFIADENWQSFCRDDVCLERVELELFYNKEKLERPEELNDKNILNVSIGGLGEFWYIAYILGQEEDEEAWIYRFDGNSFHSLISESTDLDFRLKGGRINGQVVFGGHPNDLLIVYGGYHGQILRLQNEETIIDLSKFFPLRLTGRGYLPIIQSSSKPRSFYICNSSPNRATLLKLWQDEKGKIIGSTNLERMAFSQMPVRRLVCLPGQDGIDLILLLQVDNTWERWLLTDKGFDNQTSRQVTSNNINRTSSLVRAAIVKSWTINSSKEAEDTYQLYFYGDNKELSLASPGTWFKLPELTNNLYWKIVFKTSDDPYYSPWFSDFNVINYEIDE